MTSCRDCIYYERCDTIFDGLLSNRNNEPCGQFDAATNFVRLPCRLGDLVYFIGYGVVETLEVVNINIEFDRSFIDSYIGYVEARRADGTTESIGFNVFGELAFTSGATAFEALNKEATDEDV
jgi:hypothetical protein